MRYLIDTHVYLWWQNEPERLSKEAVNAIENIQNTVFVSAAVPWEIALKSAKGKLSVGTDIMDFMDKDFFLPLPITHEHVASIGALPDIHGDPFDRIQIAQAYVEDITFVTRDTQILKYDLINTIKA